MGKRGISRKLISKFSSATLEAPVKQIKIDGANYSAVDTGDGYHIVKDVPIFSEIPKGEHGAPYDVDRGELEKFLSTMQAEYANGKFTGALSVGHNDDLGLTHPGFAGYFIPRKVALYKFAKGEKWALYADFKMPNDKFALFAAGKLPYHSPEIYGKSWEDHRIDIVSFLDTKPPFFRFAINTAGTITTDATAKFEAVLRASKEITVGVLLSGDVSKLLDGTTLKALATKFAAYAEVEEKKKPEAAEKEGSKDDKPEGEKKEAAFEKKDGESEEGAPELKVNEAELAKAADDGFEKNFPSAAHKMATTYTTVCKLAEHLGLSGMDPISKKPEANPIEPTTDMGGSKMSLDADTAAKFAAQANEVAELKAKFAAQEIKEKVAAYMAKADSMLSRKVLADRTIISGFAADAAVKADGEKWFTEIIEKLKPSLRDKPPSTVAEFQSASLPAVESTDPILSKFSAEGPDGLEKVAKFAQQYRQIKEKLGDRFSCSEDDYIKNELMLWKASKAKPGMGR